MGYENPTPGTHNNMASGVSPVDIDSVTFSTYILGYPQNKQLSSWCHTIYLSEIPGRIEINEPHDN